MKIVYSVGEDLFADTFCKVVMCCKERLKLQGFAANAGRALDSSEQVWPFWGSFNRGVNSQGPEVKSGYCFFLKEFIGQVDLTRVPTWGYTS